MSRAFIREADDAPELPLPRRREPVVPTGSINQPDRDGPPDQVRMGATVTIRDAEGESTYHIVTPEAADAARGKISWLSPLAQVLLNAHARDRIQFRDAELEIVSVAYQ